MSKDNSNPLENPAALGAFLRGDIENFLVAATPGGIEAQEAQGQRLLVASAVLPLDYNRESQAVFEGMGIVFGKRIDDLFQEAQLPNGWSKRPTGHSLWSEVLDDKNRKRISVFYKAAFYDRHAHMNSELRLHSTVEPVGGYAAQDSMSEWWGVVKDWDGSIVWRTPEPNLRPEPSYKDEGRDAYGKWSERKSALNNMAHAWLEQHYPDYDNPLAYWDVGLFGAKGKR